MIEVYVDPSFTGLSNGDEAVWNASASSARAVTFNSNGFATVGGAVSAVVEGGTVWLAAGSHDAPATIAKAVTIRGKDAVLEQVDPIVINGVAVRFRDVAFTVSTGTVGSQVRVTNGGTAGLMHCTFNGPATVAAESRGPTAGVVLCGCEWSNVTLATPAIGKNDGAVGVFAKTSTPVGGPIGRMGNHLRHKMRIDAPAEYRSVTQDQKIVWVPVDSVYGSIEPLRGSEYTQAQLAGVNATHRVELPGGLTVSPAFRAALRNRVYEFGAPLTTDMRENRLAFLALERIA